MRSTSLIGIGALTTAALLGTCFTATAHAVPGGNGDGRGNINELHGYKIVKKTGPANGTPVTVDCPADGKVTGGGVEINAASPLTPAFTLQGTFPQEDGEGWVGVAQGPGNAAITVYAICTRVGNHHSDY